MGKSKSKPKVQQQMPQAPAIRPLDAVYSEQDNQESSTRELYRQRRARGMGGTVLGSIVGEGGGITRKRLLGG